MGRIWAAIGLAALAAGCAASPKPAVSSSPASATSPAFREPAVMQDGGVDGVIGLDPARLAKRFGTARIDLAEGDARKLQYASETCVLDIYLYPMTSGSAPVATHIEARQRQGGSEIDRAACIAQVEKAAR